MPTPSKRTPAARAVILEILRAGSTRKAAYTVAGLSHDTFYAWLREDEAFDQEVEEAEQDAITAAVTRVLKAARGGQTRTKVVKKKILGKVVEETVETIEAEGDWRADAWWLERRDATTFGKRLDVTTKGDKLPAPTFLVGLDGIDDDELERRLAEAEGGEAPSGIPKGS